MMDCKCQAHVSYKAEANKITVTLDKIDWCPKHAAVDELVAALEEAKLQIQYLHDKFTITGSGAQVLGRITVALEKAKAHQ